MKRACVVIAMCLTAAMPYGSAAAADTYVPEVLFTLEYGKEDAQVGVWLPEPGEHGGPPDGPTGIAVGVDGTIYIADRINQSIKAFAESGEFLMRTEGELDNPHFLVVDSQGSIYAMEGTGAQTLSKFAADGKQLWSKALSSAIPQEVWSGVYRIFTSPAIGPDDTISVSMRGQTYGVAVLDQDGKFIQAFEGYARTPSGNIASIGGVPGRDLEALAAQVQIKDPEGRLQVSYVADPEGEAPRVYAGAEGFVRFFFDRFDCVYTTALAPREERIVLSDRLSIGLNTIVTRHDTTGRTVARLVIPSFPFVTGSYLTVDADGNIYHLSYHESTVDVVRYRLADINDAEISIFPLPSLRREGEVYVPLRWLMQITSRDVNRDLKWDSRMKRAVFTAPARYGWPPVVLKPGDEGVMLHYDRVWVSTTVIEEKMRRPMDVDASGKLAYLWGYRAEEPPPFATAAN